MWLMHTRGFFSVVQHRDDPDTVLVRARVRGDLENLVNLAKTDLGVPKGALKIEEPDFSDYAARIIMPRATWVALSAALAEEIDYPNFKDAVKNRQGRHRAKVYMDVWSKLLSLQKL
jgi:hypothetical protein